MTEKTYNEVQKLDTIWPLLVMAITLVSNWVLYFYLGYDDLIVFYTSMASALLMSGFLVSMRLYTKINTNGVHFRFFPFHFQWKSIPWTDVKTHVVRKFSPWKEYGGYGIRKGKSGSAYIVSGDDGLQMELKSGEKILICTSNPDVMKAVIKDIL